MKVKGVDEDEGERVEVAARLDALLDPLVLTLHPKPYNPDLASPRAHAPDSTMASFIHDPKSP